MRKTWIVFVVLAGFAIALASCGGGDGHGDKDHHDSASNNDNSNHDGQTQVPQAEQARHLIRFAAGRNGALNEIHIFFATDKNGNVVNLVRNNKVASFDPNCNRLVEALIESNCTGFPEVPGGKPGLRAPYAKHVIFRVNQPGDRMIPGLIIDNSEIYSLNIDFVDVEGPEGSIKVDKGVGLILWGSAATCPNFACEEGIKSGLPGARDWN